MSLPTVEPTINRRGRSRPRLTVRLLLLAVLLVGGGLGWYVNQVQVQRRAVEALVDLEFDESVIVYHESPRWAQALTEQLGRDATSSPVEVRLVGKAVNDATMAHVGQLRSLRKLELDDTSVTEAGIAHLGRLDRLQEFNLYENAIESGSALALLADLRGLRSLDFTVPLLDADLDHLAACPGLEELRINDAWNLTEVGLAKLARLPRLKKLEICLLPTSRAGLVTLARLPALEDLDLSESGVKDLTGLVPFPGLTSFRLGGGLRRDAEADLAWLAGMTSLRRLHLPRLNITDADLIHLAGLVELRDLDLAFTAVGDAGLVHLAGLKRLQTLDLGATGITDAGLGHLVALPDLEHLLMYATNVTDAGLDRLRALPKLKSINALGTGITAGGVKAFNAGRPATVAVEL